MGKENLGYPGMLPLGKSYVLGQWALHENVNPDASDPSIPEPAYFDGFWEAASGNGIVDKTTWTQTDYAKHHADALANIGAVRDLFAAYLANGPLPVDSEGAPSGLWNSEDGITLERHVYFYAKQEKSSSFTLTGAAKFLQIQGFTINVGTPKGSSDPGAWVLPREFGSQQVFQWRYNADHAGPPYDNTKWIAHFDYYEWQKASEADIAAWSFAIWGALLTILTFGVGSVAIPGIIAAAAAVSITLSTAEAAAILLLADSLVIGAMKFAATGDSSGLMSALQQAAVDVANMSPQAIVGLQKAFPNQAELVKSVANSIDTVMSDAQAVIAQGGNQLQAIVSSATKLAGTSFPLVNQDYWNLAAQTVGGNLLPGGYFMTLAKGAISVDALANLEGVVPWYAQGFLQFGATIRAAELQQYKQQGGFGMIARPPGFGPATTSVVAIGMRARSIPSSVVTAPLRAVLPTPSPTQLIAQKRAQSTQLAVVAVAGVGLAYWLGLLKFLF